MQCHQRAAQYNLDKKAVRTRFKRDSVSGVTARKLSTTNPEPYEHFMLPSHIYLGPNEGYCHKSFRHKTAEASGIDRPHCRWREATYGFVSRGTGDRIPDRDSVQTSSTGSPRLIHNGYQRPFDGRAAGRVDHSPPHSTEVPGTSKDMTSIKINVDVTK
jgi:hypothetical protein